MSNLFKKNISNGYPKSVKQIHNEFMSAGDAILQKANDILSTCSETEIEKANRLIKVGFKNAKDVSKISELSITESLAKSILYYKTKYPLCKFVNDDQLTAIFEKYKLVCGEISAYTGFVPDNKLKEIESFKFDNKDARENSIRVTGWSFSSQSAHQDRLREIHPDLIIPIIECSLGDSACVYLNGECVFIRKYEKMEYNSLLICAPIKDMKTTGLKKIKNVFMSFASVTVPDPVVLQPVKNGYLIITAWGDEASDPDVVNEKMN